MKRGQPDKLRVEACSHSTCAGLNPTHLHLSLWVINATLCVLASTSMQMLLYEKWRRLAGATRALRSVSPPPPPPTGNITPATTGRSQPRTTSSLPLRRCHVSIVQFASAEKRCHTPKPACVNLAKPVENGEMRRRDSSSRRALGHGDRADGRERARGARWEIEFYLGVGKKSWDFLTTEVTQVMQTAPHAAFECFRK